MKFWLSLRRARSGVAAALAVALCALPLWSSWSQTLSRFTSDQLYFYLLYQDAISGEHPIAGWTLQPAPSFFPDMVVTFLLLAIRNDVAWAFAAHAVIYLACLIGAFELWLRLVSPTPSPLMRAGGYAAVLLVIATLAQPAGAPLFYFWYPGVHSWVIPVGLVVWRELWLMVEQRITAVRASLVVTLLSAHWLSDGIVVPQVVAPAGVLLVFAALGRWAPWRRLLALGGLLCASGLLALALAGTLRSLGAPAVADFPLRWGSWTGWQCVADVGRILLAHWSGGVFVVLGLGATILTATTTSPPPPSRAIGLLCASAVVIAFLAPCVTGVWVDAGGIRYLYPVFLLPPFMLLETVVRRIGPIVTPQRRPLLLLPLLLLLPIAPTVWRGLESTTLETPYPPSVRCLDQLARRHGLAVGVGEYWYAKLTTALSRQGVRVRALVADRQRLEGYHWINNRYWYDELAEAKRPFLMARRFDQETIARILGPPTHRHLCPTTEVWVFGDEARKAFRRLAAGQVLSAERPARAGTLRIEAETLRHASTAGKAVVQSMTASQLAWSNHRQVLIREADPGDRVHLRFPAPAAGRYALTMVGSRATDFGVVAVAVNDEPAIAELDLYAPSVSLTGPISLGEHELDAADNSMTITFLAHDHSPPRRAAGIDVLHLVAGPRTHTVEAEDMNLSAEGAEAVVQGMAEYERAWGGGLHLFAGQATFGSELRLWFDMPAAGIYDVSVVLTRSADYGIVVASVNPQRASIRANLYSPLLAPGEELSLGVHSLKERNNRLRVRLVGADPRLRSRPVLGIDHIRVRSTADEASLEAEELQFEGRGGVLEVQDMTSHGVGWSGGAQVLLRDTILNAFVDLLFNVPSPGPHEVFIRLGQGQDYGIAQATVDPEANCPEVNLYAPLPTTTDSVALGTVMLSALDNELHFRVVGSDPRGVPHYRLGVDSVLLEECPPSSPAAPTSSH